MGNWLTQTWDAYIRWCDKMGLTPENRRCCMPRLEDPPLLGKNAKHCALKGIHSPEADKDAKTNEAIQK